MGGSLRELCKTTEFPLSASSRIFLLPAVSRIFVHRNHATFFIYMARIYGSVFYVLPSFFPAFQTFDRSGKNLPRRSNNTEDISLWTKFVLLIV